MLHCYAVYIRNDPDKRLIVFPNDLESSVPNEKYISLLPSTDCDVGFLNKNEWIRSNREKQFQYSTAHVEKIQNWKRKIIVSTILLF